MDFTMTRGKNAEARCKNVHETWGSPLYCDCGCQVPVDGDQPANLTGLTASWERGFQIYIALKRRNEIVGSMDKGKKYISLDGNEYLGIKDESALASVLSLPVSGKYEDTVTAGSTIEETAAQESQIERIELAEMDGRNKKHPGYCTKCHGFCYGECEAN